MSKIELTKHWVNEALGKLIANSTLSYNQVNPFYDKLVEIFKQKSIIKDTITASEFLVACVSYFIFHDLKQQKFSPAVNLNERKSKVGYSRDLTWMDVKESKERFNALLEELSLKLSTKCDLEEKQSLFSLLQLISHLQKADDFDRYIQRYRWDYDFIETNECNQNKYVTTEQQVGTGATELIPKKFIVHILYGHYGLDPKIAEEGHSYVDLCDAEEACNLLKVSKNNLIKKCLESSFGAYLRVNSEKYQIKKFYHSQYNQELIDEIVDPFYLYPYQGLVRIKKQSSFQNNLSLQAFYMGDGICWKYVSNKEQRSDDTFLVPTEFSLTDAIQGVHSSIIVHKNQKIKVEDLIFIKEEIQKEKPKKVDKKIRHEMVLTAFNKFMTHVAEKSDINIEQDVLPITKNELISILKNNFSLKVNIEDETIKDYFSYQGIKFQQGIKSNSAVYQEIIKTF